VKNWKLNCTIEEPKCEEKHIFKTNLSAYQMNLHKKIKSKYLIRLLIDQFDLIIGSIKDLIEFKI